MKKATSALLLLCLLIPAMALAEPLDFSNVVEKDGWLTGEIITGVPVNENGDVTLRVDCAALVWRTEYCVDMVELTVQ